MNTLNAETANTEAKPAGLSIGHRIGGAIIATIFVLMLLSPLLGPIAHISGGSFLDILQALPEAQPMAVVKYAIVGTLSFLISFFYLLRKYR